MTYNRSVGKCVGFGGTRLRLHKHWVPRPRSECCAQAEVRDFHVALLVQEEVLEPVPVLTLQVCGDPVGLRELLGVWEVRVFGAGSHVGTVNG